MASSTSGACTRGAHRCTASVPIRQIVCHRRSRVPVERPFNDADNASHLASGICHLKLTYAPFGCEGLIERETSMRERTLHLKGAAFYRAAECARVRVSGFCNKLMAAMYHLQNLRAPTRGKKEKLGAQFSQ